VSNKGPSDPELIRFLREELGEETPTEGSWAFTGPVWVWRQVKDGRPAKTAWHFVTIDGEIAEAIRAAAPGRTAAWGSVYVSVTIGKTGWCTSLFPSKNVGGYLLPVKASVRKAEQFAEGDRVTIHLSL
jgi:hypothetical protein